MHNSNVMGRRFGLPNSEWSEWPNIGEGIARCDKRLKEKGPGRPSPLCPPFNRWLCGPVLPAAHGSKTKQTQACAE